MTSNTVDFGQPSAPATDSPLLPARQQQQVSRLHLVLGSIRKAGTRCTTAFLLLLLFAMPVLAQDSMPVTQSRPVDMATTMRSNGKIYVVVTVLSIVLIGLFLYVIRLDRKITKLEKGIPND